MGKYMKHVPVRSRLVKGEMSTVAERGHNTRKLVFLVEYRDHSLATRENKSASFIFELAHESSATRAARRTDAV